MEKYPTILDRDGYELAISEPSVFIDNQSRLRSGHMSHAMAQFAPDRVIAFNSNCSAYLCNGHWPYGFIEYHISEDAGQSWGVTRELEYSKKALFDGLFTVSVEKAVACGGRIVAFCLRNKLGGCEPWQTPTYLTSDDGGESWSEAREFAPYCGRIYDAAERDGKIYVLLHCNDAKVTFTGNDPSHVYRLYISEDRGESFRESCVVPIESRDRGYGALQFRTDGSLVMYAYNVSDETHMDYAVSYDGGESFTETGKSYLAKKIRNPQTALIDGVYILHGRGGDRDFVLYSSRDGLSWDEGYYLAHKVTCYYSENIALRDPDGGDRLLVHYSDIYERCAVNVSSLWIKVIGK